MPAITQPYEVLLDFTNDTHDCATIQLLRDYGRNTSAVVLLHPGESLTLVLEAGSMYKYALKSHSKVANVRCVRTASPSLVSHMYCIQCTELARHSMRNIASICCQPTVMGFFFTWVHGFARQRRHR
jgi:hypothetical protein